jgi:hypothetical protein
MAFHPQITQIRETKPRGISHEKAQKHKNDGQSKERSPIPTVPMDLFVWLSSFVPFCAFLCLCFQSSQSADEHLI